MSSINPYSGLGVAILDTATAAETKKKALGQDEFLKLMTTQMTHQDPTKPMQNGEFLSQMAQFGTVSGIQDLQQLFKDFSASISSDQALQAASLVGRYVSAPSDEGLLAAGGEIKGKIELPSSSPNVSVKILDATGDIVKIIPLGGHSAGSVPFTWDGVNANGVPASPGVYKVQAEAGVDGVNTALKPEIESQVESVSMGNGTNGVQVNLKGLGAVSFNQIKQIL
ncbi:Basal-body rod modification protein FlgD [Candidatus Methylobacter favarea]|uniref:Basal-body rod modification protein FlgD n=1 Tax=Candidatus Methylobacter favarea TaxID=2707345 RepID=A0A8S0Y715_9GAMM|nr:flagellar hook assembly protein FlgD [Candidatus Methylobacter favarea]CAA9892689.1 Basal-body rod modification protein FlgD [Candidatus Methylobacter favarea]